MNMRYIKGGYRIQVGMGTCGIASGAKQVLQGFLKILNEKKYNQCCSDTSGLYG